MIEPVATEWQSLNKSNLLQGKRIFFLFFSENNRGKKREIERKKGGDDTRGPEIGFEE